MDELDFDKLGISDELYSKFEKAMIEMSNDPSKMNEINSIEK